MRKRGRSEDKRASARDSARFSPVGDALWSAQDRTRTGAKRGFERLSWKVRQLLWTLRDRAELAGAPARALAVGTLVLLAAGVGVAALLWAAPDHGKRQATVAAVSAPALDPAPAPTPSRPAEPPAPTLHGAAPVFESSDSNGTGGVDASQATGALNSSGTAKPNSTAGNEAAGTKISSEPATGSSTDATSSADAAKARPARGPVAGPAAVAVASRFATAFVGYEVGEAEDPKVQSALEATTTPQLGQALMERPPRLPANVEVPKAKVLNVVPAPSREGVFPISVSLLRVGTTSELRLEMQKLKGKDWLVTNVLG